MYTERIPQAPPIIKPLAAGINRRLWSVMIPSFNCSNYLKETIESVLLQDLGEDLMEIEVVDDASTDADVEAIVRETGKGRVAYFRQPLNVGSLRNFETCLNRATGHLVHLLHGDDTVRNGYYRKMTELHQKFPEAGAFFCKNFYMDEQGNTGSLEKSLLQADGLLPNWFYTIAESQRVQYVAITVQRSVYETLGSFYGVTYGEDWEMWARIAKHYPVAYTPEPLANYRLHFNSISGGAYSRGQNILALSTVAKMINRLIAPADQKTMLNRSKKQIAYNSLNFARYIWRKTHNRKLIIWQLLQIIKLHCDASVMKNIFRLLSMILLKERQNTIRKA